MYPLAITVEPGPPPGCAFDKDAHQYRIDGVLVPSVTGVLEAAGFVDFSEVPLHRLAEAKKRGTLVHQAVHYWQERDLVLDTVWEEHRGYLESAQLYTRASGLQTLCTPQGRIIGVEFQWWDPRYMVAGTTDWLAWCPSREAIVISDWKTGEPDDVAAPIQLAAYEYGVREHLLKGLTHRRRGRRRAEPLLIYRQAVKLYKDGRPGRPEPYNDPRDFGVFVATLTTHHFRINGCKHSTPTSRAIDGAMRGYV
jgi:hypothetical protein